MVRAGSRSSFKDAEEDLRVYAHVRADRRDIQRVAEAVGQQIECWSARQTLPTPTPIRTLYVSYDGTAIPMRRGELLGRKGRQPDGSAKGREVKVGCVFTQTTTDEAGRPVRDEASTSYVAGLESSTLFGERLYAETRRRGLDQAQRLIVLTDGAGYNKTIAQTHFPTALHIIDLYHAREHLELLADLLLPPARRSTHLAQWSDWLDQGAIETMLNRAASLVPRSGPRRQETLKQMRYFLKNAPHMRYADFRRQGWFIGSGVVEAGCRTLVGQRLKHSGMFWSVRGAHAILQARCCLLSERFDQFWEDRTAA